MRARPHPGHGAWLLCAALALMACGRIGFDPLARVDGDGSVLGDDGSVPGSDGSAPGDDGGVADSALPGQDAGPLQPQPDAPISDGTANPDCPVVAWTGTQFVVAWIDQRDGSSQIYVARVDDSGARIGMDVRATTGAGEAANPAIAGNGDGFALAWNDDRDGNSEIYMARFTDSATQIGGDIRVTNAADISSHPSLAWTDSGYALSWQDRRDGDHEIYAARVNGNGAKLGADIRVMNASGLSLGPSILWSGSEHVIAWHDESAGNGSQLFVARVDAAGNEIGQEAQITTEARIMLSQSIAWTGAETLAVWEDYRNDQFDIYGARIDGSGAKIGGDIPISAGAGHGGVSPELAWNGVEAGLVWHHNRDGNGSNVFMTRLASTGVAVDAEIRLSNAPESSTCPDIVWTGSQYGVAWLNNQGGVKSIYFTRVLQ